MYLFLMVGANFEAGQNRLGFGRDFPKPPGGIPPRSNRLKPMVVDTHLLNQFRDNPYARARARARKVTGVTLNRLLKEYGERRKAGTLFEDVDRVSEADMYDHTFQMQMLADRRKTEGLK